jgi:hypothetical protein
VRTAGEGPRRDITRQSDPCSRGPRRNKEAVATRRPHTTWRHYEGRQDQGPNQRSPCRCRKLSYTSYVVIYDSTQAGHARTRTPTRDNRLRFATEDGSAGTSNRSSQTAHGVRLLEPDALPSLPCGKSSVTIVCTPEHDLPETAENPRDT